LGVTIHFIGAGPGAVDLITVRGRDLIARCPVCLYAGSLVPREMLAHCPHGARIVDTAPMSLDEIVGGSPYGATTIAGGQGQRQPSDIDLEGARHQGGLIAKTANKLFG